MVRVQKSDVAQLWLHTVDQELEHETAPEFAGIRDEVFAARAHAVDQVKAAQHFALFRQQQALVG